MGVPKEHPAVVALFRLHQATATELATLKANKNTLEDTVNVRSLLDRQRLALALRLSEWGWRIEGDRLMPVAAPPTVATAYSRKTGT